MTEAQPVVLDVGNKAARAVLLGGAVSGAIGLFTYYACLTDQISGGTGTLIVAWIDHRIGLLRHRTPVRLRLASGVPPPQADLRSGGDPLGRPQGQAVGGPLGGTGRCRRFAHQGTRGPGVRPPDPADDGPARPVPGRPRIPPAPPGDGTPVGVPPGEERLPPPARRCR